MQSIYKFTLLGVFISSTACLGDSPQPVPPREPQQSTLPIECELVNQPVISPNAPIITLQGPHTVVLGVGETFVDAGARAIDIQGQDISGSIVTTGIDQIDSSTISDYLITYDVADAAGEQAATVTRIVRVSGPGFAKFSLRPYETTNSGMGYLEHLPVFYGQDPDQTYPLVIVNHGALHEIQASPPENRLSRLLSGTNIYRVFEEDRWPDSRPFIVLSPQHCFNIGATQWQAVDRFIEWATQTYRIDESRIYMTGLSAGGFFTWRFPVLQPGRVAAVAPMSGGGRFDNNPIDDSILCSAYQNLPVWSFHGTSDSVVPPRDTSFTMNLLREECGYESPPEQRMTFVPGSGHDTASFVWDDTFIGNYDPAFDPYNESLFDWFLKFRKE